LADIIDAIEAAISIRRTPSSGHGGHRLADSGGRCSTSAQV